jgi:HlyD family secretion protein
MASMRTIMKRALGILAIVIVITIFGGTLYYLYSKSTEPPVTFQTEAPFVKTIIQKTVATGSVVPRKEVEVKPQVSGILDELFVEAGDKVAEGDLIAKIRIIPNMVSLANAENRLNRARISLKNAERELARNRKLRRDGAVSESVFQQYEIEHENAKEEMAAATDNLELIRRGTTKKSGRTTNTLVRSTIDGMVLEVFLEEGDSVIESNTFNAGTTIASIADMDQLVFLGKVDESEVGKIRPGMDLLLTIGAIERQRFGAVLEHISPKGREESGAIQFEIRAAVKLKEGIFVRANYSANADIVLDRRDEVLAINEGLLQFEKDGSTFVEVETAPQVFEKRKIETGLSDGIAIEVVSGLTAEDRIKKAS